MKSRYMCILLTVAILLTYLSINIYADDTVDIHMLEEKANKGDAEAQTLLGIQYEQGTNVKKDYNKAVELYGKAANSGYAIAQFF